MISRLGFIAMGGIVILGFLLWSSLRTDSLESWEDLLSLAKRECGRLDEASAKECLRRFVTQKVEESRNRELCSSLDAEEECQKAVTLASLSRVATSEDCEAHADSDFRSSCLAALAVRQQTRSVCFLSKEEEVRDACLQEFLVAKATQNGDKEICGETDALQIEEYCRSEFTVWEAERTGDKNLCSGERECGIGLALWRIRSALNEKRIAAFENLLQDADRQKRALAYDEMTQAPLLSPAPFLQAGDVSVSVLQQQPREGSGGFVRHEGSVFGLTEYSRTTFLEHQVPFNMGRGIASGDFNNDFWPDIALATNEGVFLYRNVGGTFVLHLVSLQDTLDVFLVAFVDIDNDGWQDLFLSSYGGRNLFLMNEEGSFSEAVELPGSEERVLTEAASFGDVDGNGFLDVMLGNWSSVSQRTESFAWSRNQLFLNTGSELVLQELFEKPAETLSVLFSDFDQDGLLDLLVGNDFLAPDLSYRGTREGELVPVWSEEGVFPVTTLNTMSLDTADFNNDLLLDIFATDMSFGPNAVSDYCAAIAGESDRLLCERNVHLQDFVLAGKDTGQCILFQDPFSRNDCLVAVMKEIAADFRNPDLCSKIPDAYETHRLHCRISATEHTEQIVQESRFLLQEPRNVLLLGSTEGSFRDRGQEAGIGESYWSWTGKAADLDNDGWQDIYVGNGFLLTHIHPNTFFRNTGNGVFEQAEEAFGLADPIHTPSYTYIDLDNDGDLDIVATGINAPLRVFENTEASNNSISFEIRDEKGNSRGVGAKVIVEYGPREKQIRELKLGGGFLSFDAPLAHFGLGKHEEVSKIEIQWPSGEKSNLRGPFPADRRYVIERR